MVHCTSFVQRRMAQGQAACMAMSGQ